MGFYGTVYLFQWIKLKMVWPLCVCVFPGHFGRDPLACLGTCMNMKIFTILFFDLGTQNYKNHKLMIVAHSAPDQ